MIARLKPWRHAIRMTKRKAINKAFLGLARLWRWYYKVYYRVRSWRNRYGSLLKWTLIVSSICVSVFLVPYFQRILEPYVSVQSRFDNLRSLFLGLGTAMIGATAIAFTLVMFALQVNIERMPYSLFHRFSSDVRIIAAFVCTFVLAILITCASLIPSASWAGAATLTVIWSIFLILVLFHIAYCRALKLINPVEQLNLLSEGTRRQMQTCIRYAERVMPCFKQPGLDKDANIQKSVSTPDNTRMLFFQANPFWANCAKRDIQHATAFANRYAEQRDYIVTDAALATIIKINEYYIDAKGRTFFAYVPMIPIENRLSSDEFIDHTLEILRQYLQSAVSRTDEQQIELALAAIAKLVTTYSEIDYNYPHVGKTHACLAAKYLSDGVKSIIPHDMTDVLMEGLGIMGQSAHILLSKGMPSDLSRLLADFEFIATAGGTKENYCFVTNVAIEQLASLTFAALQYRTHDVRHTLTDLRNHIANVAIRVLSSTDAQPENIQTALSGYYSVTNPQAFLFLFEILVNKLIMAEKNDEDSIAIIGNIEHWADGLFLKEKELLILAILMKSHFAFDLIHWVAHVTKLLLALSYSSACPLHTGGDLRRHAKFLIRTLGWIPDEENALYYAETCNMTGTLFELALESQQREWKGICEDVIDLMLCWGFKNGRHQTGFEVLERSLCGAAALVLRSESNEAIDKLKKNVTDHLNSANVPNQDLLTGTARRIRDQAAKLRTANNCFSTIDLVMSQLDHTELRSLLEELANMLSPETK
jgi:hypothetical protein